MMFLELLLADLNELNDTWSLNLHSHRLYFKGKRSEGSLLVHRCYQEKSIQPCLGHLLEMISVSMQGLESLYYLELITVIHIVPDQK